MDLVVSILSAVAFATMAALAGYSIGKLYKIGKEINTMKLHLMHTILLTEQMKMRSDVELLENMKRTLNRCVEQEDYEAAKKLKEIMSKHVASMVSQVESFKEKFGDICDIDIEVVSKTKRNEE